MSEGSWGAPGHRSELEHPTCDDDDKDRVMVLACGGVTVKEERKDKVPERQGQDGTQQEGRWREPGSVNGGDGVHGY